MDKDDTEAAALRLYLEKYWLRYASEAERTPYELALKRIKAAGPRWAGSSFARRVQEEWARADDATRRAVEEGTESICQRAIERLVREFRDVQGITGRCPKCGGDLRTPLAKQCRWCHHDWHAV